MRPFSDFITEDVEAPTDTPQFENWFGQSVVTQSHRPGGEPKQVYHGTTHSFEAFAKTNQNIENFLGRAFYFTDSDSDAQGNYGHEGGPDITQRQEGEAERIAQNFEHAYVGDIMDDYDLTEAQIKPYLDEDGDFDTEKGYDLARLLAKKKLTGGANRVLEVYLRMEKPFWYDDHDFSFDSEYDEDVFIDLREEAEEQVMEDNDLNWEEDDREDWEDDIRMQQIDRYHDNGYEMEESGDGWDFINGIIRHAQEYENEDRDKDIRASFEEEFGFGSELHRINANKLIPWIKEEAIPYLYDYDGEGEIATSEVIKAAIRDAGFDGVIMYPERHFKTMDNVWGSVHYIVFEPEQVKSIYNKGSFSRETTQLREQVESLPHPDQLAKYRCDGECHDIAQWLEKDYPELKADSGWFLQNDGTYADHSWNKRSDGVIIDMTAGQFGAPELVRRDEPGYRRYVSWEEFDKAVIIAHDRGDHQPESDYADICPKCSTSA